MHYDDVAWEKSEAISDEWVRQFLEPETLQQVGNFLLRYHRPGDASVFTFLGKGAYNISFKMEYKNASTAVIRFPQPGATMFPEEKTRNEVATLRYIYDQTSIPVPFVHHWATRKDSPLELGPVIIMDYCEHDKCMYDALNIPECPKQEPGTLDPNISEAKLEALYSEAASILLQLSRPSFPRIGSLDQVEDFTWEVTKRPLSMPMNSLIRLGALPQSKLPATTFPATSSYMEALAELHIVHITNQRNDAIDSADDCRRKLVARYLFRKLAKEHRLTKQWAFFDKGPFKLWCDDFRPANILLDEGLKIVGVVDWEFTYAAPIEFSFAPPWWLLIEKPEYLPQGLDDWCVEYERHLQTFLRVMRAEEDKTIKERRLKDSQRLSAAMQDSWKSGDFWISYAARNNFAFDLVYWHKIDQRFFGRTCSTVDDVWKERLDLLEPEERAEIERVVAIKVEEMKTRELDWNPDEHTKKLLEKHCGDGS
jgi:aminoglycoside phosphotransferase (APT) family kinase protein